MRAWTSVSSVAVHHGWAKEPSDYTGENNIVHDIIYDKNDIVYDIVYYKNIKKHISFIAYDIV